MPSRPQFIQQASTAALALSPNSLFARLCSAKASSTSNPKSRIYVGSRCSISALDRNLFGPFLDHPGRAIYEGIYDPGSKLSDSNGFRKDLLKEVKSLGVPIIRYPGSNSVSGYSWLDGCMQTCPSGAIDPLTLVRKKAFKVGAATINRSRCLRYVEGGNCRVCIEKCPVPGKPLREETLEEEIRGHKGTPRGLYVVADLCIGCGICEHFCPMGATPGITVGAENEDREALTLG
jgi:NAD-dependent dihydropyrimidine dehydrogenase PreA subunit